MPELPEVEIIKRGLEKKIIGLKIQKIQVLSPKSFIGNPRKAEGLKILKIWRRAKILGIELGSVIPSETRNLKTKKESRDSSATPQNDNNITLLFHLKMSGQLIWEGDSSFIAKQEARFIGGHPTPDMVGKMPNMHTRVIFSFADPLRPRLASTQARSEASGSHLYFNDQRKFGWVKVIRSVILSERSESKDLGHLGPEPLEKGFTWLILKQNLLKHKSMPVKVAIMDQTIVSGVGNIYSNEACFDARLDPRTKVGQMSDKQFETLYRGIIKSLKDGIKYGGSTKVHFVDPEGRRGYFLDYAKVYGKEGYPCKARLPDGQGCSGKVKKITLGGRGTYFCPACQY